MPAPTKVASRILASLRKFQPILSAAKSRDVNESDTVTIVMDLLQEIFGYDKYTEITSEHAIRGTYCDLAVKLDGQLALLIEVKAVGLDLKDAFVKQAVDYAANQGTEWVILTNAVLWRAYRLSFGKPIESELVLEFNLLDLSPKADASADLVWLLAKEGWQKSQLGEYHTQKQALSRFTIGALLLSDVVVDVLRRELRRASGNIKVSDEDVRTVLEQEVIKREVLEGEKAEAARRLVNRAAGKALRAVKQGAEGEGDRHPVAEVSDPQVAPGDEGKGT